MVVHGPGTRLDTWVDARTSAELAAVAFGIVAAVLATVCVRLWLDKRELRRDLEREREVIGSLPARPPARVAEAPPFTLEDRQGETISSAGTAGARSAAGADLRQPGMRAL